MTEQIKLAPCPFCEGPPCVEHTDHMTGKDVPLDRPQNEEGDECYQAYVRCHDCGAQGPSIDSITLGIFEHMYDRTVMDVARIAAERWNERHNRARSCYDAGQEKGLNLFPRNDEIQPVGESA